MICLKSQNRKSRVRLALIAALMSGAASAREAAAETATRGMDFVNGLGVNTHIVYTDSQYANNSQTLAALSYLGIKLIRDVAPNPQNQGQGAYAIMARAGIKLDLFNGGDAPGGTQLPTTAIAAIAALAQTYPGSIHAVEGPNEVNNGGVSYGGVIGGPGAQAYQNAVYMFTRSNPETASIPVYNFTNYPDTQGTADYANFHSYPDVRQSCQSGGLYANMKSQMQVMPGRGIVNTELGAPSAPQVGAPDQTTQARFLVSCALDNAANGVKESYFYQLFDGYADPAGTNSQRHFGLFDSNYTPKKAATALRNLVRVTSEAGSSETAFQPGALNYRLAAPSTVRKMLMQQASGWWILAVWNDAPVWNGAALNPQIQVSIQLSTVHQQNWINDVITGSSHNAGRASTVNFTLSADPVVLAISPN